MKTKILLSLSVIVSLVTLVSYGDLSFEEALANHSATKQLQQVQDTSIWGLPPLLSVEDGTPTL